MKVLHLLLLGLLLFILNGCHFESNVKILKIGTNSWPGYESLHLAQINNLYNENIKVIEYNSASEVLEKYRKGSIHAAALTLDEVIRLKVQGYSPIIVSVLDISNGADSIISTKNIKKMQDLKGKYIGVEDGALGAFMLNRALEYSNMKQNELEIISLSIDKHESAFKENIIDAVVTFEPVRSKLLNYGGHEIFSSKLIPNEIVDVLVVDKNYYNQDYINDILQALDITIKKINSNDVDTLNKMSKRLALSTNDLKIALEGLVIPRVKESNRILETKEIEITINKIQDIMYEASFLSKKIDAKSLLEK